MISRLFHGYALFDGVEVHHGLEDRDHDQKHDRRKQQDHGRFEEAQQTLDLSAGVVFQVVCDADQHVAHVAGFLADAEHRHGFARHVRVALKRRGELLTGFQLVRDRLEGLCNDRVMDDAPGDPHRADDLHMVRSHDGKRADVAAHLQIGDDAPDQRYLQFQLAGHIVELLLAEDLDVAEAGADDQKRDDPPRPFRECAERKQAVQGGRRLAAHVGEDVRELRHEDGEQQDDDDEHNAEDHGRVDRVRNDKPLQVARLAHELVELDQHFGKAAGLFAGFDQVRVVVREERALGADQLGELLSFVESLAHVVHEGFLPRIVRTLGDDRESAFQGDVRTQQRGELAGKRERVDAAVSEQIQLAAAVHRGFTQILDRNQAAGTKLVQRFFLVVSFDQHFARFVAARGRQIFIQTHAAFLPSLHVRYGPVGFFHRRNAEADLFVRVLTECAHAVLDGDRLKHAAVFLADDGRTQVVRHGQELEDAGASLEPCSAAAFAAVRDVALLAPRDSDVAGTAADRADLADKSLGQHAVKRGGHQEGLDAHIQESGHGADCVVGVKRAQHQVAGESSVDGDVGGFTVTDFADEDDVGVLTDNGAEARAERHADLFVHLHLAETSRLVFDRVFDGDNLFLVVVQLIDHAVECGRLAASGGAHHEDDAVRDADQLLEVAEVCLGHAQRLQVEGQGILVEESQHDTFAGEDRERTDTHVQFLVAELHVGTAVLRETAFGNVQAADQFNTGCDGGELVQRAAHDLAEHTVDTAADHDRVFAGFHVDIAGAVFKGACENVVHKADDLGLAGHAAQGGFVIGLVELFLLVDVLEAGEHAFQERPADELEANGHVPALADKERDMLDGIRVGDQEEDGAVFLGPFVGDAEVRVQELLRRVRIRIGLPEIVLVRGGDAVALGIDFRKLLFADGARPDKAGIRIAQVRRRGVHGGITLLRERGEALAEFGPHIGE